MSFITHLRIKNFFSVKNEIKIDFKASPYNITNNPDRLFEFNGEYYNKIISFYGANASGKTTVLKALIVLGAVINNEQTDKFPKSFKNKFAHLNSNSELEFGFVLFLDNEKKEFLYNVTFKSQRYDNFAIDNEELYIIENNKRITFFNRKKRMMKYVDEKIKEIVFDNLNEKKSLVQEFIKFEEKDLLESMHNFTTGLVHSTNVGVYKTTLNTDKNDEMFLGELFNRDDMKDRLESFFIRFFDSIGIDIDKINAKFKEIDGEDNEFLGVEIFHKIESKEPLEFSLESDGTQMLMKILLDIFFAKEFDYSLIIDEFDSIIHPVLVPILNRILIENNIQIIYSTHNIYNMQFLQNDEIFLIEKDSNHETTVRPIKDNSDIKGYENLLTHYENGYLGGMPKIEDIITEIF
jgi:AAA15 family ATPase/GTPase